MRGPGLRVFSAARLLNLRMGWKAGNGIGTPGECDCASARAAALVYSQGQRLPLTDSLKGHR